MNINLGKSAILGAVLCSASLLFAGSAKADDLQITCTGATTCAAGGIETTTSTSNLTFSIDTANMKGSGTLFLAILVPTTGGNFSSGDLWTALGEGTGGSDHNFASATSFFAGITSFNVTDMNLGAFTGGTPVNVSLAGPFVAGTQFVAFLEDANGNILLNSPNSESLEVTGGGTSVPEPGALGLLLVGLVDLGVTRRFVS